MSDNVFIGEKHKGTVRWLSMDASKMEGSHTRRDIQDGINFVLDQWKIEDPKTRDVYDQLLMGCSWGVNCILGSKVINPDYLASGSPITADFNCMKMAKALSLIIHTVNDEPFLASDPNNLRARFRQDPLLEHIKYNGLVSCFKEGLFNPIFKFFGL